MDIEQTLKDTVDQQNHARWTGSMYALKDSINFIASELKNMKN